MTRLIFYKIGLSTLMVVSFSFFLSGCAHNNETDKSVAPLCIGRVIVDLPKRFHISNPQAAPYIMNEVALDSVGVSTQVNVSLEEFNQIVTDRWAEIQTYTHDEDNIPYTRQAERNQFHDNGWMLSFKHKIIDYSVREPDGSYIVEKKPYYLVEAYYWDNGTMFKAQSTGISPEQRVQHVINAARYLAIGEIPQEPGVCLHGGFIAAPYLSMSESVTWELQLPDNGLALRIEAGYLKPKSETLKDYAIEIQNMGYVEDFHVETLRQNHLTKNGEADELVYVTQLTDNWVDGKPQILDSKVRAMWELSGHKGPNPQPYVHVELGFSTTDARYFNPSSIYPELKNDSQYPTEKEFFVLWDTIISSVHFYPQALASALEQLRPNPWVDARYDQQVRLTQRDGEAPAPYYRCDIIRGDGTVIPSVSDENGWLPRQTSEEPENIMFRPLGPVE